MDCCISSDIIEGYLNLNELQRTIPLEPCVCIDLMALRTLTGMGGSSATAPYPCNWNHLHQRNKGSILKRFLMLLCTKFQYIYFL
jgi:hypothetical protein